MSEPATTDRPTVAGLAAEIDTPDVEAGVAARRHASRSDGRLASLGRWLAEAQGQWPPSPPRAPRLLVFTPSAAAVDETVEVGAATHGVSLRTVLVAETDDTGRGIADAFAAGAAAADTAVDEGTDLLVLTGVGSPGAAGVLVSAFTGTEPIALLPRGADAVDTAAWIARAIVLRDQRRRVVALRHDPDGLLVAAGSPLLAALAGCVLRATARRTPLVLDGVAAVSAALLCNEQRPDAARWWQIADTSPDPIHARAIEDLDRTPVLGLGSTRDDGTAGLLTVSVLRAAAAVAKRTAPSPGGHR